MTTVNATYDGQVLRPDEPLSLPANSRVQITIEEIEETQPESCAGESFLDTAQSLNLEGPPDWSERLEEYLYGDITADG